MLLTERKNVMDDMQLFIIFCMELTGTVAFAASGAMVGIRRGMDIFGVCVLGVVTAVGGGMTRDVILGTVPGALLDPVYVMVAVCTALSVFFILYYKKTFLQGKIGIFYEKTMFVMDTAGLGIFTVIGVITGIHSGYLENTFLLTFLPCIYSGLYVLFSGDGGCFAAKTAADGDAVCRWTLFIYRNRQP